MRVFLPLMPRSTTTVEVADYYSQDLTATKNPDHREVEPAAKKIVMTIKQDKEIEDTPTMKGIKVSTGSSSSEDGNSKPTDNQRELIRVNISGRGKVEPPEGDC